MSKELIETHTQVLDLKAETAELKDENNMKGNSLAKVHLQDMEI